MERPALAACGSWPQTRLVMKRDCRDLVSKNILEWGKDAEVFILKPRGPLAKEIMNQRWDRLQNFLLNPLGQNLSPDLRP